MAHSPDRTSSFIFLREVKGGSPAVDLDPIRSHGNAGADGSAGAGGRPQIAALERDGEEPQPAAVSPSRNRPGSELHSSTPPSRPSKRPGRRLKAGAPGGTPPRGGSRNERG